MSRKHNEDGNAAKVWRFTERVAGSALLILAAWLLIVSSAIGQSPSTAIPQPNGASGPGKVSDNSNYLQALGTASVPCTTISYAGEPLISLPIPLGNVTSYSMRFSPGSQDSLKSVAIGVYDPGDGSYGDDSLKIHVFDDDGFGLPGVLRATKIIPPGSYSAWPILTEVSFADLGLVFTSDFHIAISTSAQAGSGRYESILSDSGVYHPHRSCYYSQGQWYRFADGSGPDHGFCISVTLCHYWLPTSIAGKKFNDLDGNGVKDYGEPGIANWKISLLDANYVVQKTCFTDQNGDYSFGGLDAGIYTILEEQRPGWTQTFPTSVFYLLHSGQELFNCNFGNDSICNGDRISIWTFMHGTNDNFTGAEASYMSTGLDDYIAVNALPVGCQILRNFDEAASDSWFGHTFDFGIPREVWGATLRIKLRASSGGSNTDWLALGHYDGSSSATNYGRIWSTTLNDLYSYATGVTQTWENGYVMDVTLNLANLPIRGWLPTNILAALQSGSLDIVVSDDTEVDFIELTIYNCDNHIIDFCGDANGDGTVDISDAVYLIAYIFSGGPGPITLTGGDANNDGSVDISDVVYLIAYIFSGGPAPCEGKLGRLDPTTDEVGVNVSPAETESGQALTLQVEVDSKADIAGLQLEFAGDFDADDIVITTSERSRNLQLFAGVDGDLFKVGLVDLRGQDAIAAGSGSVVDIELKGEARNLELLHAIACDRDGQRLSVTIGPKEKAPTLPDQFSLSQNHPNPFNPTTEIRFALPKNCEARVEVLNVLGQTVKTLATGMQTAGTHQVIWDGTDERGNSVSSGVYFYRLVSDEFSTSRKMLLLK